MGPRVDSYRYLFIVSIFMIFLFFSCIGVSGEGSGDFPPPDDGDWIITNNTYISNETIVLNDNLEVLDNASLTLENVTLLFNSTLSGDIGIYVDYGSSIFISDSNFTTIRGFFTFYVSGNMTMVDSHVSRVTGGIFIGFGDVKINNCSLYNNLDFAISGFGNPVVTNNTIFSNHGGILTGYGSAPLIINNKIISNGWGIISNSVGYATIMGNNISHNSLGGINVELGHLNIHNNTISQNGGFGIRSDHAIINATNNSIFGNERWGIYSLGAQIISENNNFKKDGDFNGEGDVILEWEVHIKIYDTNNESVDNVNLSIVDKNDNLMWQGTTIGNIRTVFLREYEITHNGTELIHTPFTITATSGIHQNITTFDIPGAQESIFASETIRIIIDIEEDEIVSDSTPQWFYLVIGSIWLVVLVFAIVGLMVTFKKRKRQS